jgi:hypothetical protein
LALAKVSSEECERWANRLAAKAAAARAALDREQRQARQRAARSHALDIEERATAAEDEAKKFLRDLAQEVATVEALRAVVERA